MSMITREDVIKPGNFGSASAADSRRYEFDAKNEMLLLSGIKPDAVFIGDSITHLWELQASFGGTGNIVVNRGIGGDVSSDVRKRFTADAIQLQPSVIVLLIGTNDYGWGFGFPVDRVEEISENIAAMAAEAHAARIPLAICSILPIWGPNWYPLPEFTAEKTRLIVATNARLREIATESGAIYVDYFSRMAEADNTLRHALAEDGIHPLSVGYHIMAEVLRETLAEYKIEL